jgi:hypothetical protein
MGHAAAKWLRQCTTSRNIKGSTVEVEVEVTLQLTVGQSVSMSRYRAHSETFHQILLSVRKFLSESCCPVSVRRPL